MKTRGKIGWLIVGLFAFVAPAMAGDVYLKALEHARSTANNENVRRETKATKVEGVSAKTEVFAIDQHKTMHLETCVILQDARKQKLKINRLTYEAATKQGFAPCRKCLAPAQKNDDKIDNLDQ